MDNTPKDSQTLKEQGFYHTKAWRHKRKKILLRDHYLCQLRLSENCTRKATTVHHIKALEDYPQLALVDDNLTSCCYSCHEETKTHKNTEALDYALSHHVRVIRITGNSHDQRG